MGNGDEVMVGAAGVGEGAVRDGESGSGGVGGGGEAATGERSRSHGGFDAHLLCVLPWVPIRDSTRSRPRG